MQHLRPMFVTTGQPYSRNEKLFVQTEAGTLVWLFSPGKNISPGISNSPLNYTWHWHHLVSHNAIKEPVKIRAFVGVIT